jgi:hypothetical protein
MRNVVISWNQILTVNSFALRRCEMYRNVGEHEDSISMKIRMWHCGCIAFGLYYLRNLESGESEANVCVDGGL